MNRVHWFWALSVIALISPHAAAAQADLACMSCRATAHFRTCDKPMTDAKIMRGKVTGVEKTGCSQILSVDLIEPAGGWPARIRFDLDQCTVWAGETGDVIDVGLRESEPHASNLYSLACNRW
jgi:hypothetical protein